MNFLESAALLLIGRALDRGITITVGHAVTQRSAASTDELGGS